LTIRYFLKRENDRRDRLMADPNYVHERYFDEQGQEIDATFMDITDVSRRAYCAVRVADGQRKNMAFRYPL
jgi:hypothetical protein